MGVVLAARRRWVFAVCVALPLFYLGARMWLRTHVNGILESTRGRALPEFALADAAGRVWTRADCVGHRVVLHFFRSHCSSCEVEAAEMRALETQLAPGDLLLHVMTDRVLEFAPRATQTTLARMSFSRPVVLANAQFVDALHTAAWSNVTPITYLVDAAGHVRAALRGRQAAADVLAALAALQ